MSTKMTAQDRRFAAMRRINDRVFTTSNSLVILVKREHVAQLILSLHSHGRTERWHKAVDTWAHVVRTEDSLRWAYLQWSVYTGYAA